MSLVYRVLICESSRACLIDDGYLNQFWFDKPNEAISFATAAIKSSVGGSTISIRVEDDGEEEENE